MLFHSPLFLLFLLAAVAGTAWLEGRRRACHLFLLAASYAFYMAWSARLILLILFSTLLDYWAGAAIHRASTQRARKLLLGVSLVGNLGVLALFKYYGFFAENLDAALAALGVSADLPILRLVLPVGISFYTFQTLSYTIDVYRGTLEPCRRFVDFALFVAFFPQLVAGPIVRASEFLPQLEARRRPTDGEVRGAIYLFLKGLTKKLLFADVLASFFVDPVFKEPSAYGGLAILLAIYAFKFQIYGDFAGYSEMAIACGKLLGFDLPVNFRAPYKARSFRDYWARWHLTLGRWFRDYLFFPLGGSRGTEAQTYRNIVLTMTLVGLWHGAAWTFVVWGLYHGLMLSLERAWAARHPGAESPSWLVPIQVFVVFNLTGVASFIFRAPDMRTLASMARRLLAAGPLPEVPVWAGLLFVLAVVTHLAPERWKLAPRRVFEALPAPLEGVVAGLVLVLGLLVVDGLEPFYYFQF
ncbi:MAG: MBOAT family O-acyltransferase [Thermoanaerobaculia bacterium]